RGGVGQDPRLELLQARPGRLGSGRGANATERGAREQAGEPAQPGGQHGLDPLRWGSNGNEPRKRNSDGPVDQKGAQTGHSRDVQPGSGTTDTGTTFPRAAGIREAGGPGSVVGFASKSSSGP